jgi:hypothetical protein
MLSKSTVNYAAQAVQLQPQVTSVIIIINAVSGDRRNARDL